MRLEKQTHSSNGHFRETWSRTELEARNFIQALHVGSGAKHVALTSAAFQDTLAGSRIQSAAPRIWARALLWNVGVLTTRGGLAPRITAWTPI